MESEWISNADWASNMRKLPRPNHLGGKRVHPALGHRGYSFTFGTIQKEILPYFKWTCRVKGCKGFILSDKEVTCLVPSDGESHHSCEPNILLQRDECILNKGLAEIATFCQQEPLTIVVANRCALEKFDKGCDELPKWRIWEITMKTRKALQALARPYLVTASNSEGPGMSNSSPSASLNYLSSHQYKRAGVVPWERSGA